MRVLNRAFDHPMQLEEHAAMPLAGGIMLRGYQCGMLWGSALAAGAQAYRVVGAGPQAESRAITAAQRLVASFQSLARHTDCREIAGFYESAPAGQVFAAILRDGGFIGCFGRVGDYARVALGEINAALADRSGEASPAPVSCAAQLARNMGASDLHTTMASGLAGGIGLAGGGCGALAAAVWLINMNSAKEGMGTIDYKNPEALAAVERFARRTDGKFECARVVGRKFESIDDHAGYLRAGGCSAIIDALATA